MTEDSDAVALRDVHAGYGRGPDTVRGVSLRLARGGSLGLVGESGSGKTTVARVVVGLLPPRSGTAEVFGAQWGRAPHKSPNRRRVQLVFQDPYGSLNPKLTPLDTVADVVRRWAGVSTEEARARAACLLDQVGLSARTTAGPPSRLSGGQCQRVGVARALAADPELLVADEPTSALDVSVQAQILNLLRDLVADRGLALLLISHDLAVVRHMTDHAVVLKDGVVVESGPTDALLHNPTQPYTRLLVDSIPGTHPRS